MKYSLRSLFLLITLIAVVLGVRIEYLKRMAAYHEREIDKSRDIVEALEHSYAAEEYQKAILRPWTVVKEKPE